MKKKMDLVTPLVPSNHDNYLVRDIFIFILDVPALGLNI